MGKIRKQFSVEKHGATLSPFVSRFIKAAESLPLSQLPNHLATFPKRWPFSRGDLYHWIEVLNRFDDILERFNDLYGLINGPQTQQFARELLLTGDQRDGESSSAGTASEDDLNALGYSNEGDRELVEAILTFTTLLFENCGNRSLYASSSRLTGLLNTVSLTLLEATLRLGYRLAQRYTASRLRMGGPQYHLGPVNQSLLAAHYDVDVSMIQIIAQPISRLGMISQNSPSTTAFPAVDQLEKLVSSPKVVDGHGRYALGEYKNELEVVSKSTTSEPGNDVTLITSAPVLNTSIPIFDLLKDLLHGDKSEQRTILHHVRAARAVHGTHESKLQILSIRLLALANLFQIWPEEELQAKIFIQEQNLPRRLQLPQLLCDLVNPPVNPPFPVPKTLQSLAFVVLESLTHHKSKSTEVCTALNINVSHGTLATTVRKAVNEIAMEQEEPESDEDVRWLDNLFVLLHALPKATGRAVDGLVSAGLVDMLIEIVTARTRKAERNQAIAVNFLSAFVYNTKDAFDALINAQGLDAISELLSHEIELSLSLTKEGKGMPLDQRTKMNDYEVPFAQQQCLRALFKFVNGMLNISGGPIDRLLRNLVESSHVLNGLRVVLANPNVYGSNVWTGAINIFSNFINNEPTSYAAIAEAGLTKALLETVVQKPILAPDTEAGEQPSTEHDGGARTVKGILPACESIHALPDAFGAVCLNEGGMSHFEASGALETFFEIFTSPPHVKALGNSSGSEIEHLGQSFDQLARHHPRLKPKIIDLVSSTADRVAQLVLLASSSGFVPDDTQENIGERGRISPSGDVEMEDASSLTNGREQTSTPTSIYISVYSKFLSSLFRNTSLCGNFAEKGGVESLLAYATAFKPPFSALTGRSALPCMHRLSRVIHTLAEQKPHLMLPALISRTQEYADKLCPLIDHPKTSSFIAPFIVPNINPKLRTSEKLAVIRALEPFQMLCDLLLRSFTPSRASATNSFVSVNMADMCVHLIDSLNLLNIRLLQEKQMISEGSGRDALFMPYETIKKKQIGSYPFSNGSATSNPDGVASSTTIQDAANSVVLENEDVFTASNTAFTIPDTIRNLFQSIAKALLPRRMPSESYQKQSMITMADHIAQALVDQLSLDNLFNADPDAMIAYAGENARAINQVILPSQSPYDDSGRSQIRTAVLLSFKEKGGLVLLGVHAKTLFEQSIAPQKQDESPEKCKARQHDANTGFRGFLEMFANLIDQKTIQEAHQTGALTSRPDREREKADFFSPYQFLVELRLQVITAVSDIWISESLEKSQSSTVRVLSSIVQTVLEGAGEPGAFKRSDKLPSRSKTNLRKWRPRNDQVRALEERGYGKDLVREALYRCGDSLPSAEEYCAYYHNQPSRVRHPIPAAEVVTNYAPETHTSNHQSSHDDTSLSSVPEGPRPPTPLPSVNELATGIPATQYPGELDSQPTAFIDALSDVARTILEDSGNGAYPADSATNTSSLPNESTLPKAEALPEVVTVEDLDDQRSKIRENLVDRCLSLLGIFDEVTFEMASLIIASVAKAPDPYAMRQDISGVLILSLVSYQGSDDIKEDAKKVTAIAHLLGIILQEKDFFEAAQESLKDSFASLLAFLTVFQSQKPDEESPWIPQILLIVERTLAEDVQPNQIVWEPPQQDQTVAEKGIVQLPDPMVSAEEKVDLFNCIADMLPRIGKNLDLGLAAARVLVTLTRSRQIATTLSQKRHMQRFLVMIKQLAPVMNDKLRSAVMLVLRNIIEDDETIRQLMRSEVKQMFEKSNRPCDTTTYTRGLYYCVLRAPEIFVEVTNELLELSKFDRNQSPQNLTLKKPKTDEKQDEPTVEEQSTSFNEQNDVKPSAEDVESPLDRMKSTEFKPPIVENPDGVVHFLLCELLAYKDVEDKVPQQEHDAETELPPTAQNDEMEISSRETSRGETEPSQDKPSTTKEPFKAEDHPIFVYRGFILQCLTELLASYNRTKIEFINFSRKADPQAMTPSKPRSGVLNYLLNALIPTGSVQKPEDDDARKKSRISNLASGVIIALCVRTSEHGSSRHRHPGDPDDEPELLFVRRFVLEHALKAFKDANTSSDPQEAKYSKMLSIGHLFDRMLAGKQSAPPTYRRSDPRDVHLVPTQKELAKIMFEKNFIGALTNCMSDIDHTVPGSDRVVKYILRPLELLTHTAIELSLSADISTLRGGASDGDEISSASSVSDIDEAREETPDLYRNSALGMFEPGREDESSSESGADEDEDELYNQEYGDDMEYDEAEHDPDEGEVVSDEDEAMDGMGAIEGLPGEMGMDIELEIDGGEGGSEEDEEDEEDSDDEEDDSGEEDGEDDDDVEIMDEITGDEENDSLLDLDDVEGGEWRDDEEDVEIVDYEGPDGARDAEMLDLLGPPPHLLAGAFDGDESHSEGDGEARGGHAMANDEAHDLHEHLELHMDPEEDPGNDEVIEEFSAEEEDEDEEFDEEVVYRTFPELEDDDSEMPSYAPGQTHNMPWGARGPGQHRQAFPNRHFMPRHSDRDRFSEPWRHRAQRSGAIAHDDGANPLLNRNHHGDNMMAHDQPTNPGRPPFRLPPELEFMQSVPHQPMEMEAGDDPATFLSGARGWVNGAENYITGLLSALQRNGPAGLMAHHHHHHHHLGGGGSVSFRIGGPMAPGSGPGDMMEILLSHPGGHGRPRISGPLSRTLTPRSADPANSIISAPVLTMERWQEQARLIFGPLYTEKCSRVINSIMELLVPPALEAERIRKIKAAEEAKKREEERVRLEAERAEKEAQEKKEREEREAREALERAEAAAAAAREREDLQQSGAEERAEAMEGVEPSEAGPSTGQGEATSSTPAERVYTMIRGRQLDITDLGIDQTFLEELPEDMREEVIMQQFVEHRAQFTTTRAERTDLNPQFLEFLDAVPPEIREELLQQEAQDRRRRERERRAADSSAQGAQADDMDTASFMATLDPGLRQTVLAEADERVLASLPAEIAAEARALGGPHRRRLDPRFMQDMDIAGVRAQQRRNIESLNQSGDPSGRTSRRPIVQMFEKSGIATLLRLMFIPALAHHQPTLNGILRNACGNHQTRGEIVSGLLAILQDGSNDVSSIDKSFLTLTQRAKLSSPSKHPHSVKKSSNGLPWTSETAPAPSQVLGNCLSALIFLTQSIPHVPKFFLTEHELTTSSKAKLKGKGKAKDSRSARFPINDLLSLLNRDLVITNTPVLEQLASLLQSVTQPLNALLKKDKDEPEEATGTAPTQDVRSGVDADESATVQGQAEVSNATEASHEVLTENHSPSRGEDSNVTADAVNDAAVSANPQERPQEQKKPFEPPEVPEDNLRLVINILSARDCGGKSFRDTLSTINNLSAIPKARKAFGQELVSRARELGQSIQAELKKLTKDVQDAGSELEAQNLALTKFSPTGSDQAKLNRILTALDYLFDTKAAENKNMSSKQSETLREEGDGLLTSLYEDPTFSDVWNRLSSCLSATRQALTSTQQSEKQSDQFFLHISTILLPLIESLMVVCKRLASNSPRTTDMSGGISAPTTPAPESVIRSIFFSFTNRHKKILNDLVRHNPKLMSGSFSVLVKNSTVLEFDNKRNYFNRRLHQRAVDNRHYPHPSLQFNVMRDRAFQDSFKALHFKKPEEIKYGKLNIRFHNEEGVDAGGVTREWFQVLARQMFDPNIALFNPVAADQTTFHPNHLSSINDLHLQYFKFIGRLIGKALYENRVLDCHFSRAVYKRILGKSVSMKDMETIDLDYTKSLQWMLDNDITDILTETFSITTDNFGVSEVVDLIENGRNLPVTDENKHEYVRLMVEHKLTGSVKDQLESFLQGFYDIVPTELISIFDEGELELLISGMPEVDVDDWKANTDYHNYSASSPQIQWFWRAVRSFDKEERAKLLQFVTGTGKVPLNGFKELEGMNGYTRFSIHKDYGNKDRLPSSHTCFNQLDLPEYESYESLRKNVYTAMTTGGDYFGFA